MWSHTRISFSNENVGSTIKCESTDESRKCDAEGENPDAKEQNADRFYLHKGQRQAKLVCDTRSEGSRSPGGVTWWLLGEGVSR